MQSQVDIGSLTLSLEDLGLDELRARRVVRLLRERLALRLGRVYRPLQVGSLSLNIEVDPAASDDELADAIARALANEVAR